MNKLIYIICNIIILTPAFAQETLENNVEDDAGVVHTWSVGVDDKEIEIARKIFTEANLKLNDSLFKEAANLFSQAREHWNHPGIHYMWAMALVNLDRPIEMYHHLTEAIKYGPRPLKSMERYDTAKNYIKLLDGQLVKFHIKCQTTCDGARVTLDGKPILEPPAEVETLVRPGDHVIVASKPGFVPNETRKTFLGGQKAVYDLRLLTEKQMTVYRHRWEKTWIPWTVAISGGAIALAGGVVQYIGVKRLHDLESQANSCRDCAPGSDIKAAKAKSIQRASIPFYAVGGVTLATGLVLTYLNRAIPEKRPYQPEVSIESTTPISVMPISDGATHGLAVSGNF